MQASVYEKGKIWKKSFYRKKVLHRHHHFKKLILSLAHPEKKKSSQYTIFFLSLIFLHVQFISSVGSFLFFSPENQPLCRHYHPVLPSHAWLLEKKYLKKSFTHPPRSSPKWHDGCVFNMELVPCHSLLRFFSLSWLFSNPTPNPGSFGGVAWPKFNGQDQTVCLVGSKLSLQPQFRSAVLK